MKTRVGSFVLFLVFAVLGPTLGTSEADDHGFTGKAVVLYELNEQAQITELWHRIASSGLQGKAARGTPLCSETMMAYAETFYLVHFRITVKDASRCSVVAFGQSDLDLSSFPFEGTIGGAFYVVVNSDLTNLTDAPELFVMAGTFEGNIQVSDPDRVIIDIRRTSTFTPTDVLPGFPGGVPPAATFTGKFRLPFKLHHIAVYKSDSGRPVAVRPDERALGEPTVRVEVNFD
jgi:hypothetical protein